MGYIIKTETRMFKAMIIFLPIDLDRDVFFFLAISFWGLNYCSPNVIVHASIFPNLFLFLIT